MVEKLGYGFFFLQKCNDRRVLACNISIFGIATWIGQGATVEDVAAAVAGVVGGEPLFVAEALDGDGKLEGVGSRWSVAGGW